MEWEVHGESELKEVANTILLQFGEYRKFTLEGNLGAGKTALVKAICLKLGTKEPATSPSFSIVNQYAYKGQDELEQLIYHIDLYRLKNLQEALDIGIEDYLYDDNYCFIEWPDIAQSLMPENVRRIKMTLLSQTSRKILIL